MNHSSLDSWYEDQSDDSRTVTNYTTFLNDERIHDMSESEFRESVFDLLWTLAGEGNRA